MLSRPFTVEDWAVQGGEATVSFEWAPVFCGRLLDTFVRVRSPSGAFVEPTRVELNDRPGEFLPVELRVSFVGDEVGTWLVEATVVNGGSGRAQVLMVEDLRAAPLERFPFAPAEPCDFPILTADGVPLCAAPGSLAWPVTEPGAAPGYHTLPLSALWADGDGVWVADTAVSRLQSVGDGGLIAIARTSLPEGAHPTAISGDSTGVLVATDRWTIELEADDAGTFARTRQEPLVPSALWGAPGNALAFLVQSSPYESGPPRPFVTGAAACQVGSRKGGTFVEPTDCLEIYDSVSVWSTPRGLWLTGRFYDDTVEFVDLKAFGQAPLPRPKLRLPGFAFSSSDAWMTAPSAVEREGGPEAKAVLLPLESDNEVVLELVAYSPRPGVTFARATQTHVFFQDANARRELGESPWLYQRRAASTARP